MKKTYARRRLPADPPPQPRPGAPHRRGSSADLPAVGRRREAGGAARERRREAARGGVRRGREPAAGEEMKRRRSELTEEKGKEPGGKKGEEALKSCGIFGPQFVLYWTKI